MEMTSRSGLVRRGMRRVMLAVVMLGLAVVAIPEADADTTEFAACENSQAVAVSGVNSPSPTCSFILVCDTGVAGDVCAYAVALEVNGTGQVAGSMSSEPIEGEAVWVAGASYVPGPSCSGLWACRAGTRGTTPETQILLWLENTEVVRVICSGGGAAVLETISCSATDLF